MTTRRLKIHVAPKILTKSKGQLNGTDTILSKRLIDKPKSSLVTNNSESLNTEIPRPHCQEETPTLDTKSPPVIPTPCLPQRRLRQIIKPVVPSTLKATPKPPDDKAGEKKPPVLERVPPILEPQTSSENPATQPQTQNVRRLRYSVKPKLPSLAATPSVPEEGPPVLEPVIQVQPPQLQPPFSPQLPSSEPLPEVTAPQLNGSSREQVNGRTPVEQKQEKKSRNSLDDMKIIDLIFASSARSSPLKSPPQKKKKREPTPPPPPAPIEQQPPEILGPQLIVNDKGEFVVDEASLILDSNRERRRLESLKPVLDNSQTTYSSFTNKNRNHNWSPGETKRFYHALSTVGTDFHLMCNLMPQRSRQELKNKFKREEKKNPALIDKIINKVHLFNLDHFREREATGYFDDDPPLPKKPVASGGRSGRGSKKKTAKGDPGKKPKNSTKQDQIIPPPEPSKKPPDKPPFALPKISIIVRTEKDAEATPSGVEETKPKKFFTSRSSTATNGVKPDDRLKQVIAQKTSLNLSSDKYSLTCLPHAYRFRNDEDRQKLFKQLQRKRLKCSTNSSPPIVTTSTSTPAQPSSVVTSQATYRISSLPVSQYNLLNSVPSLPFLPSDRTEKQNEILQESIKLNSTQQKETNIPVPHPATTLRPSIPATREVLSSLKAVPILVADAPLFNTSGRLLIMPGQSNGQGKQVLHVFFAPDCQQATASS